MILHGSNYVFNKLGASPQFLEDFNVLEKWEKFQSKMMFVEQLTIKR